MNIIELIRSYITKKKYNLTVLGHKTTLSNVNFEGNNAVFSNTFLSNCHIGRCTYISHHVSLVNVKIGGFCSIANDVHTCNGQHPTSIFVTTFPAFYYNTESQIGYTFHKGTPLFNTARYAINSKQFEVILGSDVWIGSHVLLMPGVSIGDGAIVAAGSVVTKDVEPYSIVGGVPAKEIKKRFTDAQIEELLNIKWWNWPFDEIKSRYKEFVNVEKFCRNHGENILINRNNLSSNN